MSTHRITGPFWRYYGGKYRAAPLYPAPRHKTIVEPLAMAIALPCVAAYAIDLRSRCLAAAGCIAEQAAEAQEAVARARIAEGARRRHAAAASRAPDHGLTPTSTGR
jgi:hypothetical protein